MRLAPDAVCELVAGRAARASAVRRDLHALLRRARPATRRRRRDADVIAAYSRALELRGGRGGGARGAGDPRRAHITMLRMLLTQLGRDSQAADVHVPTHRVGPPETLSAVEYGNLIRAPAA